MSWIKKAKTRTSKLSGRSRAVGMFFATSVASRAVGICCQLLQVPLAVKALGSEAFGLWMTLMSVSFMINFADFGVGQGAQNKLAEAFAAGRKDRARVICGSAVIFLSVVALVLGVLAVVVGKTVNFTTCFHLIDPAVQREAQPAVIVSLLLFCLNFPLGFGQRLAYSLQKGWTHNVAQAVGSVGSLGGLLVAVKLHMGLVGIIVLAQAPMLAANAVLLFAQLIRLKWLSISEIPYSSAAIRDLLKLGAYFGVQQILLTLMISLPQIMISASLGASAVTPYNLAQRLFNLFAVIQNAFMLPLWPAYSEAIARKEYKWIRRTLFMSVAATLGCSIVPMALGSVFAKQIFEVWIGTKAELPSSSLIWLLFFWNSVVFLQQPFGYMLAGISVIKRITVFSAASAIVSGVAMYLLVHGYRQEGVVIGMLLGFVPLNLAGNIWETGRVLKSFKTKEHEEPVPVTEPTASELCDVSLSQKTL